MSWRAADSFSLASSRLIAIHDALGDSCASRRGKIGAPDLKSFGGSKLLDPVVGAQPGIRKNGRARCRRQRRGHRCDALFDLLPAAVSGRRSMPVDVLAMVHVWPACAPCARFRIAWAWLPTRKKVALAQWPARMSRIWFEYLAAVRRRSQHHSWSSSGSVLRIAWCDDGMRARIDHMVRDVPMASDDGQLAATQSAQWTEVSSHAQGGSKPPKLPKYASSIINRFIPKHATAYICAMNAALIT